MIYFELYLAVGVVVLALVLIKHQVQKKREGHSIHDALSSLYDQNRGRVARLGNEVLLPAVVGLVTVAGWPIAVFMLIKESVQSSTYRSNNIQQEFAVAKQDLGDRLSIEVIEQNECVTDPMGAVPDLPFGHLHGAWNSFRSSLESNDELWSFSANRESSRGGALSRTGYVVVRGDKIGSYFMTVVKQQD